MDGFYSSSTNSTPLSELRRRQVASLSGHNLQYRQIVPDSQFEITLGLGSAGQLPPFVLTLLLMPAFPDIAPIMYLRPSCTHPWINSQGQIVGHDKLANWSQHVSLGRIVKEIETEFTVHPPQPSSSSGPTHPPPPIPSTSTQSPAYTGSASSMPYGTANSIMAQRLEYNLPPANTISYSENIFPSLDAKSLEEINRLLEDDSSLEDFFLTISHVRDMKNVKHDLVKGNAEIAERTLSNEDEVQDLKRRIKALQELQASHRKTLDELLLAQQQELLVRACTILFVLGCWFDLF
ncbi:hypothetical protein RTP6_001164 [Batrachochytrium dendrobatidis]